MQLNIVGKPKDPRFTRKMEQFCAYGEHFGLLMGGGWNSETKTAEFYPEAHKPSCCDRLPVLARITPEITAKLLGWLQDHGMEGAFKR